MSEPINHDEAVRIATGEAHFETESIRPCTGVPVTQVNRLLLWGFIGMAVITVVAVGCLLAFSIYRGQERQSFNSQVTALEADLDAARKDRSSLQQQVADINEGVQCRAQSQLDLDAAQAQVNLVIATQFASAIDQVPPPPDADVVNQAAANLQAALQARAEALAKCP